MSNPGILSWHVHIIYRIDLQEQLDTALSLRNLSAEVFQEYLGSDPECPGRYDWGRLCLIDDHDFVNESGPGPFPVGEWSMFVPIGYYGLVVPWFLQNHGELSMLVHPNTGFEYEDHSIWASWTGEAWPLNLAIFTEGEQTNEFGQYPGDAENPVCMPSSTVCGDVQTNTTVLCCAGLACNKANEKHSNGAPMGAAVYRCQ
jgi:aromatic ring-cleaving dioxygenase